MGCEQGVKSGCYERHKGDEGAAPSSLTFRSSFVGSSWPLEAEIKSYFIRDITITSNKVFVVGDDAAIFEATAGVRFLQFRLSRQRDTSSWSIRKR
jgi:hypothetical protein